MIGHGLLAEVKFGIVKLFNSFVQFRQTKGIYKNASFSNKASGKCFYLLRYYEVLCVNNKCFVRKCIAATTDRHLFEDTQKVYFFSKNYHYCKVKNNDNNNKKFHLSLSYLSLICTNVFCLIQKSRLFCFYANAPYFDLLVFTYLCFRRWRSHWV